MNFIMIGLLLREALDRHRVRLNMYLVKSNTSSLLRRQKEELNDTAFHAA